MSQKNKNQIMHTAEPWEFRPIGNRFGFQHKDQWLPLGSTHSVLDFLAEANGKRIVRCINALAGIREPEEFVERSKQYEKLAEIKDNELTKLKFDHNDLLAKFDELKDACIALNESLENDCSITKDSILHVGLKLLMEKI